MLVWLLGLPRPIKRLISVCADIFFLLTSLIAAYALTQQGAPDDVGAIALAFTVTGAQQHFRLNCIFSSSAASNYPDCCSMTCLCSR